MPTYVRFPVTYAELVGQWPTALEHNRSCKMLLEIPVC